MKPERSALLVAVVLLAGIQPLLGFAAVPNAPLPVCASIPKIISFGDEYRNRTPPPEGSVVVEVTIEVSGVVSAVRIVESSDARLNQRALRRRQEMGLCGARGCLSCSDSHSVQKSVMSVLCNSVCFNNRPLPWSFSKPSV